MLNAPSIRIAEVKDVRSVCEFMKRFETATSFITVDVDYSAKEYERLVASGIATMLILEDNGKMIGGLGFIVVPDINNGILTGLETYWYVAPEYRGGGLLLLRTYEEETKKRGCKRIAMVRLMDSYPETLEKLYLRRGYKLVEKHYIKEF